MLEFRFLPFDRSDRLLVNNNFTVTDLRPAMKIQDVNPYAMV
jgi:hypothetical protein